MSFGKSRHPGVLRSRMSQSRRKRIGSSMAATWQDPSDIALAAILRRCPAHSVETHAHARETGIMYGDNRADERAARRLRRALETAPNFAFFRERRAKKTGSPAPSVSQQRNRCARRIQLTSCLSARKAAPVARGVRCVHWRVRCLGWNRRPAFICIRTRGASGCVREDRPRRRGSA